MRLTLNLIKWLIFLLIILGLAFLIYLTIKINEPATTTSHPRDFEIRKGEQAGEIVDRLQQEGLVKGELLLKIYLRFKNTEGKLQAGSYILDSNMSIPEIVEVLTQGKIKSSGTRVTIIEGWTISDIGEALEEKGLVQKEEFSEVASAQKLEGYLFPDTYLFRQDAGVEGIITKMQSNFKLKVGEIDEDTLILASIIEKEVGRNVKKGTALTPQEIERIAEERRIVSGIFMNRLEIGMPLESDATVTYITGRKASRATLEEIKIDSPYNTYKYRGLPPAPISNPSLDAIKAALQPARTDYLFFLTDASGIAHFAKSLEEHRLNRQKYLE